MKKHLYILPFLVMPLMGEEVFSFIGVNTSYKDIQPVSEYHLDRSSPVTFGLTLGIQSLRWRTDANLEHTNDYTSFNFNADYIVLDSMFGTPKIRPYVGLNAGYLSYNDVKLTDTDGILFGANAGLILYANDVVDIDIGYRYDKVSGFDGLDTMQGVSLSVHYFY